ncbi:MAG: hypothetical protein ACP5JJ_00790 [Anaerolineae bacterium]
MKANDWTDPTSIWLAPAFEQLDAAIISTVAYADVFNYPLTAVQIHRYLVGLTASLAEVKAMLTGDGKVSCALSKQEKFYTLRGREDLVEMRQYRVNTAAKLWPRALRYGHAIAKLPFVRMVALTGALTMDNVKSDDDFDYLIVTEAERLWLTRALVIGLVVKLAARQGEEVCPNYLLSKRALFFEEHNLYTAHELAQMIPLSGLLIYQEMRRLNTWTDRFLPNAKGPPKDLCSSDMGWRPVLSLVETMLQTRIGTRLERWERERKILKFTQQVKDKTTVSFDQDRCKGHFKSHAHIVQEALVDRLQKVRELAC